MSYPIKALRHILTFKNEALPFLSGLISAEAVISANNYSRLKLNIKNLPSSLNIGDTARFAVFYQDDFLSNQTQSYNSGNFWITGISVNGINASLDCLSHDPSKVAYLQNAEWSNQTLFDVAGYAAQELGYSGFDSSTDVNTTYVGTAEEPTDDPVVAPVDDTDLDFLFKCSKELGFLSYVYRDRLYVIKFNEPDFTSLSDYYQFDLAECIDASVRISSENSPRQIKNVYYQPNTVLSPYTSNLAPTNLIFDLSDEGYRKNQQSARMRMNGKILESTTENYQFSITFPGEARYSNYKPGARLILGDGFPAMFQTQCVITEVTHRYSSSNGWTINLQGSVLMNLPY